jgi:hypothetical protein
MTLNLYYCEFIWNLQTSIPLNFHFELSLNSCTTEYNIFAFVIQILINRCAIANYLL